MSRLMIGCDHLISLVNLHTPALWAWTDREENVRRESLDQSINPHHMLQRLSCTSLLASPIRILSFANSSSFMVTRSFPSAAAFSAAWFTRFSSSAPEKPTVPLAMISASTATKQTILLDCPNANLLKHICFFLIILTRIHFNFFQIPLQDFCASLHIWSWDCDQHVKPAWSHQSTEIHIIIRSL